MTTQPKQLHYSNNLSNIFFFKRVWFLCFTLFDLCVLFLHLQHGVRNWGVRGGSMTHRSVPASLRFALALRFSYFLCQIYAQLISHIHTQSNRTLLVVAVPAMIFLFLLFRRRWEKCMCAGGTFIFQVLFVFVFVRKYIGSFGSFISVNI